MNNFGWDLPPGCSMNDIERHFGGDVPSFCEDCPETVFDICDDTHEGELCCKMQRSMEAQNKADDQMYKAYMAGEFE